MAVGMSIARAVGPGPGRGASNSSVREVCLIGVDRRSPDRVEDWTVGREVRWLGRTYRVHATADDSQDGMIGEAPRRYVHLTARAGD